MTLGDEPQATPALADNDPTETIVIAMPPPPRPHHDRPISQTTEHLLIAAGSIGKDEPIACIGIYADML